MRLHNRFPPHFYKRGNLFNTYLNYSDDQSSPAARSKQATSLTAPERREATATTDEVRLAKFVKEHLSLSETRWLLHQIAARLGVQAEEQPELDERYPIQIARFIEQHAPEKTGVYLAVLEQRLERGERLLRHQR